MEAFHRVIPISSLSAVSTVKASITDVKYLTSYTWDKTENVTPISIEVPGCPEPWPKPPMSWCLGITGIRARESYPPLDPLLLALRARSPPEFKISNVDLVVDRSAVEWLLHIIQSGHSRHEETGLVVEIAGTKTALFTPVDMQSAWFSGLLTAPDYCTGHFNVIGYEFGGINCVVRHRVDAYIDDEASQNELWRDPCVSNVMGPLSNSSQTTEAGNEQPIKVEVGGKYVPISSTMEIQSYNDWNRPEAFDRHFPGLWVSQTPRLVSFCRYRDDQPRDVTVAIQAWEAANQSGLHKLVDLLQKIITAAKDCPGHRVFVQSFLGSNLKITAVDRAPALEKTLYSMWDAPEKAQSSVESPAASKKQDSPETGPTVGSESLEGQADGQRGGGRSPGIESVVSAGSQELSGEDSGYHFCDDERDDADSSYVMVGS